MKKALLVLAASLALGASAQSNLKWKVVGGMNISTMSFFDSKAGFHLGTKAQLDLPQVIDGMYVNAGALFSQKGAKLDMGDMGYEKINAYYLEIPIHVGYKYDINDNFSVFGEAGPYFAVGLGGKTKTEELVYDNSSWNPEHFEKVRKETYEYDTFGNGGLKRFDLGLGIHAGVEFKKKFSLSIGYDWGLLNVAKNQNEGADSDYPLEDGEIDVVTSIKNGNLSLTLGYTF